MDNNGVKIKTKKRGYEGWDKDAERLILYADVMGFKVVL